MTSNALTIRDKTETEYTFFWQGGDICFSAGLVDLAKAIRVRQITSPRGIVKMWLWGFLGKGDFKLMDHEGKVWRIRASLEDFLRFLEWQSIPPASAVRESLPADLGERLRAAERVDGEYDLLIPTNVAPLAGQALWDPEELALLAFSSDKALFLAQAAPSALSLPETPVTLSALRLVPVSEMPSSNLSQGAKQFAFRVKRGTRGEQTLCHLSSDHGHEVFLRMGVEDLKKARERIRLAEVRSSEPAMATGLQAKPELRMGDSAINIRDKNGEIFTFSSDGSNLFFTVGLEPDESRRKRIDRFTEPRGGIQMAASGWTQSGKFRFLDAEGHEWAVETTGEALTDLMAWTSRAVKAAA